MFCFEMPISSAAMHHSHEREITTMSIYKSDDESIPRDTEAHYEAVASQEKHIWRRVEEELRAVLIFGEDLFCDRRNTRYERNETA